MNSVDYSPVTTGGRAAPGSALPVPDCSPGGVARSVVARAVVEFASEHSLPIVVGNGFLLREIASHQRCDNVMHLLAGMGLAPAFAAGIALGSNRPTIALEGDGNHLMGLPSTAAIGLSGLPILHIVHWNGAWESTGGQRFAPEGAFHDVALSFGYRARFVVFDPSEVTKTLEAALMSLPAMVHLVGSVPEAPAKRTPLTMFESSRRFGQWLTLKGPLS